MPGSGLWLARVITASGDGFPPDSVLQHPPPLSWAMSLMALDLRALFSNWRVHRAWAYRELNSDAVVAHADAREDVVAAAIHVPPSQLFSVPAEAHGDLPVRARASLVKVDATGDDVAPVRHGV